jgi:hypothetical protein
MKFVSPSHFADPDAAARKLVQIIRTSAWSVRSGAYPHLFAERVVGSTRPNCNLLSVDTRPMLRAP